MSSLPPSPVSENSTPDNTPKPAITWADPTNAQDVKWVQQLFWEYGNTRHNTDFNLEHQNFDVELADPVQMYGPPHGCMLLAWRSPDDPEPVGAVALRYLKPGICEMKRMFIRPEGRRLGLGRALAIRLIDEAKELGYGAMWLDTLSSLTAANALYQSLGFVHIPDYNNNPLNGVVFWGLNLTNPAESPLLV